ncbi:unnamed protein product [Timema podura]|uniref:Uncharacterized protein n=1 Tax=Timema podura TaxID=61482 RepID=A0ABN7NW14_TIMPD|nr:unnamed protein product [Timema podura]
MAIVETESDIDTEKIMRHKGIKEDLKCEKLRKQRPRITLFNIPIGISNEQSKDVIGQQNLVDKLRKEEFNESFNLKFKTAFRYRAGVNHVAEVTAKVTSRERVSCSPGRRYSNWSPVDLWDIVPLHQSNALCCPGEPDHPTEGHHLVFLLLLMYVQVLNPDTEQKFTKRGKKRPPDLVIPDEINAFKAEQWIENLRQPAEMAGLVPYTVAQDRSEWFRGRGLGLQPL